MGFLYFYLKNIWQLRLDFKRHLNYGIGLRFKTLHAEFAKGSLKVFGLNLDVTITSQDKGLLNQTNTHAHTRTDFSALNGAKDSNFK